MDLTIKDVANYLNVSESTIRRWVTEQKIPAYRLYDQYRFSLIEIQEWVMTHNLSKENGVSPFTQQPKAKHEGDTEAKGGSKQFSLYRAINKGGVFQDIAGQTKDDVIRRCMKKMAKTLSLDDDVLSDLLLDREKLQSTALNHGIAVPHTRDFLLSSNQDAVAVAFLQQPIPYGALDGKPVHTLFFLFASDNKRHLHLLAKIAHLSNDCASVDFLKTHPSKEKMLEYIRSWESSIPQSH